MKKKKKNITMHMVCLMLAIMMWIGLKYNQYIEEKKQIKKLYQIEQKTKEQQNKEEITEKTKEEKKIITKKEVKKTPDILSDTNTKETDTLTITTESQ